MDRDIGFLISIARSGTKTLHKLVQESPDIKAYHDMSSPTMNESGNIQKMNDGTKDEVKEVLISFSSFLQEKVYPPLDEEGYDFYFESNCAYVSTFWKFAEKRIPERLKLVHLMRNPILNARSMRRIVSNAVNKGWAPMPWYSRNEWTIGENVAKRVEGFFMGLWHFFECGIRGYEHKVRMEEEGVPIFHLRTHQLNDKSKISDLFDFFGIDIPAKTWQKVGNVYNSHGDDKYDKSLEWYKNKFDEFYDRISDPDSDIIEYSNLSTDEISRRIVESMNYWTGAESLEEVFEYFRDELSGDSVESRKTAAGKGEIKTVKYNRKNE